MLRLWGALATLAGAAFASFAIVQAMPGDPVATTLFRQGIVPTQEVVAAVSAAHGLDQPVWWQFLAWLGGLIRGDWGTSLRTGEPILHGFLARTPVSLAIGGGGLALGAASGFALGIAAAGGSKFADRLGRTLAVLAQAVPAFAFGVVVIYVFGVELRWIRPFTGTGPERVVLPTAIVALYTCGALSRLVRNRLIAAMAEPWFVTARAKGLPARAAVLRHAGPFGLVALFAALRAEAAWVVGGTAVTEVLFGAPGISAWVVDSIAHRDYRVLEFYILAVAVWMVGVHVTSDFAVRALDPRIGA